MSRWQSRDLASLTITSGGTLTTALSATSEAVRNDAVGVGAPSPTRELSVRVPWRAAIAVGVAATMLALSGSWIPSIWGDEATSILSAQRSLPSLFRMLGHIDAVHGTYYLLLHFWVNVFGASPFSVRLPSAVAVGAAAVGVVMLGTRLGEARAGLWAGIIFAVLPRTTYMGEEARGYALSAACAVWATIVLLQAISAGRRRRMWWALYLLALAACGYVFLFSLLVLVPHALLALWRRDARTRRSWLLASAGALVVAAPVVFYGFAERGQVAYLASRNAAAFASVSVGQWFGTASFAILAWALVIAATAIVVHRAVRRAPPIPLLSLGVVWMLGPTAVLLLVNAADPLYSSRYLSFTAPAVGLVLGGLAARLRPAWVGAVVVLVLVVASAPEYLAQRTPFAKNGSDWAAVAQVIRSNAHPGDGILFDETARPSRMPRLAMAAYPSAFTGLIDIAIDRPAASTNGWRDSTFELAQVRSRLVELSSVWLIEYRAPGHAADTYDLTQLRDAGFTPVRTIPGHASEIIHLTKP